MLGAGNENTAVFLETKRYVLNIIRVQNGNNLLDILESPSTETEEDLYAELLRNDEEQRQARAAPFVNQSNADLTASTTQLAGSKFDLHQHQYVSFISILSLSYNGN